jgi:hypothetical protein
MDTNNNFFLLLKSRAERIFYQCTPGRFSDSNALRVAAASGDKHRVELPIDNGTHVNGKGGYFGHALQVAPY